MDHHSVVAVMDHHLSHRSVDQDSEVATQAEAMEAHHTPQEEATHQEVVDTHQEEVDTPQEDMVDSHQEEVDTPREDMVDSHQAVAQDTNKFQSDTKPMKAPMLTINCCTKSRKSCSNKNSWEVAADTQAEDMVDTQAEDMEESHQAMAFHHQATESHHQAMAFLHTALDALLELNSETLLLDTKSLNT
jgi:hypothetical protein